jgi:hypothetical protein
VHRGGGRLSNTTIKALATRRRTIVSALVMVGIAGLASGCSAGTLATKPDARVVVAGQARLDEVTGAVVFPMDKYAGPRDSVVLHAQLLVEQKCMAQKGFDYKIPNFQGVAVPQDFRVFGLWNMKEAEQYGYGVAPDPAGTSGGLGLNGNLSSAEQSADSTCSTAGQNKFRFPNGMDTPITAGNLAGSAAMSALKDSNGKKLVAAWQKCMTGKGIQVNSGGSGPLMAYVDTTAMPLEQQIKIAVQEVECKTASPSVIQQLVDIDASYQVVLIRKYQTVLNDQLTKMNAVEAAAKKYIAQNG